MGIFIDEENRLFTLATHKSAYQMRVNEVGYLLHQYYGKRIGNENVDYLLQYGDVGFSGNPYEAEDNRRLSPDTLPQEYTGNGVGDFRINSVNICYEDGTNGVDFRFHSFKVEPGKYGIPGQPAMFGGQEEAETLVIVLEDSVKNVQAHLYYSVWEKLDIVTRSVVLKNCSNETMSIKKAASMCLDFPFGKWDLMHFYGRHLMERQAERIPLYHGIHTVSSNRGGSSHHHNPFVILCEPDANEDYGMCFGLSLVYSGGFELQAEIDQMEQTRLVMGLSSQNFSWIMEPGQSFYTPEVVMTFSDQGLSSMSHKIHQAFRRHLCRSKYVQERKPVLINNWEATYFDFNEEKILDIAKGAAELGVEMLVLDDGWFGKRNSDRSSLGDWDVNTSKLKGGLKPLVDKVNQLRLKFGIWVEPEMISENSDLYRNHPDWALQMPGRKPNKSRSQLVLDMSREDVRDYLYEKLSAVFDSANIEYVKWDVNRNLSDVYSANLPAGQQGEVLHRHILGVYDLLERITSNYPDILLEGCSGGGGRFDPAMLYYSPQIWCSDDTDAIERVKIQYGTSFGYPISAVGSHVSAVPNHQTGRTVSMDTRGVTAMAGSFGYELDLNTLSAEDKEIVKDQIIRYKKYYPIIQSGTYYRLNNPMEESDYAAWEYVSEDKTKILVHGIIMKARVNQMQIHVRLKGLDQTKQYRLVGSRSDVDRQIKKDKVISGLALMNAGIVLPYETGDYQAVEMVFEEYKNVD